MMVAHLMAAQLMVAHLMAAQLSSLLLCVVLSSVAGFSVDTNKPIVFQSTDHGFGYQVVQMDKRVIVSAPLHQTTTNRTGQLYDCNPTSRTCQPITISGNPDDVFISLGLSVAINRDSSQLLACGPTLQNVCGTNIYVYGRCYQLNSRLEVKETLPPKLPECNVFSLDIALLIDGSGSIHPSDFTLMLNFVSSVMDAFKESDTQFALMQYSNRFQKHFDFNTFSATRNRRSLTGNIKQLAGQTYTSSAIEKVLNELFIPESGSRDGAKKILIVITDGETVGENPRYPEVIGKAERMGIRRFVIGVGDAFKKAAAYQELVAIASDKTDDHIMRVNDFSALINLKKDLENKIFAIEGTQSQTGSSFQLEMSQEGFSAILTEEGSVLGAVGAYDWSGGASIYKDDKSSTWINATREEADMKDSYMGYALLQVGKDVMAFGAPRYQHIGSVQIFKKDPATSQWHKKATAIGDKIGSYFGSSLSVVQVNTNTFKTLLLVGAPTYYSPEVPGGRVYLCPVPAMKRHSRHVTLSCLNTLHGDTTKTLGHFGSAISVLPDLTGDDLPDLAVGAPCEDNNQGALYIFAGQPGGFRTSYIQRIAGRQVSSGLMLFGRSMSGNLDMSSDGLPDLAVGSNGNVLIMRTRPVLEVSFSMAFKPQEISLSVYECPDPKEIGKELQMEVCIATSLKTSQYKDEISAELKYTLSLDSGRTQKRAQFKGSGQSLDTTVKLTKEKVCRMYSYQIPVCVDDSLSPLRFVLNFSMSGDPVLSENSSTIHIGQVPFQKNCGGDGVCHDVLRVTSSFGSLPQLVVGVNLEVNLTISVQNHGDDSYNSRVLISYPAGLSYRRVSLEQSNKRVIISCAALDEQRQVNCGVNNPLLRPNTTATFVVSFHVSAMADLSNSLSMAASVTSDNVNGTEVMKSEAQLKVVYGIYVTITSLEESTKNINFSSQEMNKESNTRYVQHVYRVNNLGQHALPLSISFMIPLRLKDDLLWEKIVITSSEPGPANCTVIGEIPAPENSQELLRARPLLDCNVTTCCHFICNISHMEIRAAITFTVSGQVTTAWAKQTELPKVPLQSRAEIGYDFGKYQHILDQNERFVRAQAQTTLEVFTEYNYLPVIVGSSVGGLIVLALIAAGLYKLGFFKRQYKQMMDEPNRETTANEEPGQKPQENIAPA
ncbi:integrin alpha-M-like [Pelobates cultripes]|uniref:Integrin alpha-M-like n=1 Tax=Pelobates cultripes TaxID=61616 RepID=A0AAD1SRB4_PELCU|nr:integrin alpha-M-like [Pelobates cultripes]